MPLLLILSLTCVASSISIRLLDPLVPAIAREYHAPEATVALLATAFSFPYALGQPILGPLGDALGKVRIIKICTFVVAVAMALTLVVPTLDQLFAVRILTGVAAGGIFPLAIALVGDRFDIAERQVAISRLLMAALVGQLLGAGGSGIIGDWLGWRASMLIALLIVLVTLVFSFFFLKPRANAVRKPLSFAGIKQSYATIFANPRAPVCFLSVFLEGIAVFGILPRLAGILELRGAGSIREAGLVIAGFGLGGVLYTLTVPYLLAGLGGMFNMMRFGGVVTGLGLASIGLVYAWPVGFLAFVLVGWGFYMIHNSLQTQATELAPANRGAAVSLHAFFFFTGQACGPIAYAFLLPLTGIDGTVGLAGLLVCAVGLGAAFALGRLGPTEVPQPIRVTIQKGP